MVNRFIHAKDKDDDDNVVATFTETDDTVFSWNVPIVFPSLPPGNYTFVLSTPETGTYTVLASVLGPLLAEHL